MNTIIMRTKPKTQRECEMYLNAILDTKNTIANHLDRMYDEICEISQNLDKKQTHTKKTLGQEIGFQKNYNNYKDE